jgi:DNA-binding MarR family transcriptional regulator
VTGRLREELAQGPPFTTLEVEAALNIARTADLHQRQEAELLRPFGITPTQYNVLRILRGAGAEGHTCTAIAERMLTKDPDVTRLLDRLETRGLVTRGRHPTDRRAVNVRITGPGRELLTQLDAPVDALHRRQLARLGEAKLRELIALLEAAREASAG